MASTYFKGGRWYLRFKDSKGNWRGKASAASGKREAQRLADDEERSAQDQREQRSGPFRSVEELMAWWLENFSVGRSTHKRSTHTILRHFSGNDFSRLPLGELGGSAVETFLHERSRELAPQTLNHLRRYLLVAFNCARRAGLWHGINPVTDVKPRRVPKRPFDYLRQDEVVPVLTALAPHWRPLFATAIFTGLRKGELLALRKTDMDLKLRLMTVQRSYHRDTTKGGHADVIPIALELMPYLQTAISASPSVLVFPAKDGSMMREDVALESVLRRALGRAGIVEGYQHVCRRKGCGYVQSERDNALRNCPNDRMKLWPKVVVRKIRFHDLRHTTASLLLQSGASIAAVQRIMRHKNPKLTTEVYGHLEPGYLQDEINRLSFASPVSERIAIAASFATDLLPEPSLGPSGVEVEAGVLKAFQDTAVVGVTGVEPVAFGSGGRRSIQLS